MGLNESVIITDKAPAVVPVGLNESVIITGKAVVPVGLNEGCYYYGQGAGCCTRGVE